MEINEGGMKIRRGRKRLKIKVKRRRVRGKGDKNKERVLPECQSRLHTKKKPVTRYK